MESRITAIDPGSLGVGIATFRDDKLLLSSQIKMDSKEDYYKRLYNFSSKFSNEFLTHGLANVYVIEMPFVGFNANTAIKLSQVRGMILDMIYGLYDVIKSANNEPELELPKIVDITPLEVRHLLGFPRGCKKEEMQTKLREKYPKLLNGIDRKNIDEIDAIAIGLAGYQKIFKKNV